VVKICFEDLAALDASHFRPPLLPLEFVAGAPTTIKEAAVAVEAWKNHIKPLPLLLSNIKIF
jgi:hypothetical protein